MSTKVSEIMTNKPFCFHVPSMVEDLVGFLIKRNLTGAPVTNGEGKYVGMVSRRDVFSNPSESQTAMLMRKEKAVRPDDTVEAAAREMALQHRRHVAVVGDDGTVVGILTPQNFLDYVSETKGKEKIASVMKGPSFALWEKMPVKLFLTITNLSKIYAFPVLDAESNFKGIITDRDVFNIMKFSSSELSMKRDMQEDDPWSWEGVRNFTSYAVYKNIMEIPNVPVERCMITEPKTVEIDDEVSSAVDIMKEHNFNQLPVLRGTRLVGMLYDLELLGVIS